MDIFLGQFVPLILSAVLIPWFVRYVFNTIVGVLNA